MAKTLDAATASRKTESAKRRIAAKQHKANLAAKHADKKQIQWELRVQVPEHLAEIEAAIKKAINKGQKQATWSCNYDMALEAVDKIKKQLSERKFTVTHNRRSGTSDMGDFNAPCVIHWVSTDFTVSW